MSKEKYYSDSFISNWVAGNLTADETTEFRLWLQQHPEEQGYFKDMEALWHSAGKLNSTRGKTVDQRWQLLEQKIDADTPIHQKTVSKRRFIRLAMPAAAVLMLFFLYKLYLRQEQSVVITAVDNVETVMLPDSSIVRLNTGARITYQRNAWKKERRLNLEGEAFFDVRQDNIPFIVQTSFSNTEVMGTTFHIKATVDSVAIACFTGKVAINNPAFATAVVQLTAGWGSAIRKTQRPSLPTPVSKNRISWSTGILSFKATLLREVIADLTGHYGVRIHLQKKTSHRFTGVFDNKPLKEVIEIICFANNLSFSGSPQEGYIIF